MIGPEGVTARGGEIGNVFAEQHGLTPFGSRGATQYGEEGALAAA